MTLPTFDPIITPALATKANIDARDASSLAALAGSALKGDGISGRVLRQGYVLVEDGTTASTIKCTLASYWNGDSDGPTDDCAKNATTGNFTLNAAGDRLTVEASAFSGNVLMAFGYLSANACGTILTAWVRPLSDDISIRVYDENMVGQDITTLADSGELYFSLLYLTDA